MRAVVERNTPEVVSTTAAWIVLKDPETGAPIAEVAIRGAGYVVLTEDEKSSIAGAILVQLPENTLGMFMEIADREGGYVGEPRLWEEVAAAQAEKRAASRGGVVKVAGKRVRVVEKLEDIVYPEGATFLPPDADGYAIIVVPSRKGETTEMKRFRRACKRARVQQFAFIAAQKNPESVTDEEPDAEDGGED